MRNRSKAGTDMESFRALGRVGITPRECEVLCWIAHGKRDSDIATILGISTKTVGKHVEHILEKLHVENRTAAVSAAYHALSRLKPTRRKRIRWSAPCDA